MTSSEKRRKIAPANPDAYVLQSIQEGVLLSSQDSGRAVGDVYSSVHFLAKHIAFAIYDFLDGDNTQLARDLFLKQRRQTMVRFMTSYLEREHHYDWEKLVNVVTNHIIGHRLTWGLHNKTTLKFHPICQNNLEGQRIAEDLAVHISSVAFNIVLEVKEELELHTATMASYDFRDINTHRADFLIDLSPCDLCGLVLKACDLCNEPPLLDQFFYRKISDDERARVYLRALKPEKLNQVIAAYMNEQKILREGGSYCSNDKCLRLIHANGGLIMPDITYSLIGNRLRRVCSLECRFVADDQRISIENAFYQLDKSMT